MLALLSVLTAFAADPSCSSTGAGTWCTWSDGVTLVFREDTLPTWPPRDAGLEPGASVARVDVRCTHDATGREARTTCAPGRQDDPSGREEVFTRRLDQCFDVHAVPPGGELRALTSTWSEMASDPGIIAMPLHMSGTSLAMSLASPADPRFVVVHTALAASRDVLPAARADARFGGRETLRERSLNVVGPDGWLARPDRDLPEVFPARNDRIPWVDLKRGDTFLLAVPLPGTSAHDPAWLRARQAELAAFDLAALPPSLRVGVLLDRLNVALRLRDRAVAAEALTALEATGPDLAASVWLEQRLGPVRAVLSGERLLDDPCRSPPSGP